MNKSVLFIIPYLCDGGAERALSNITTHFPSEYNIDILVNCDKKIDYLFRGNIISLGIDDEKRVDSVWFQFRALIRRIYNLKRIKEKDKYYACISFMDSANFANILTGNRYAKTIVSVRNSLVNTDSIVYKFLVNPMAKLLYNRADKVVAVSQELAIELENEFAIDRGRIVVIENGYDLEEIRKKAEFPIESDLIESLQGKKVVCCVGRLTKQKYHWHLIRAFKKVSMEIPNAILLIVGTGKLEEYLSELIKECNLEEKVILYGFSDNVYSLEKNSDIFVFPSGWEGFPNALAEAMCVGLPCIATDFHTGAREILAPELLGDTAEISQIEKCGYGILTPLCSGKKYRGDEPLEYAEEKLAEAMIMLLQNDALREEYRKKSLERSQLMGIDEVVKKWIAVIESQN